MFVPAESLTNGLIEESWSLETRRSQDGTLQFGSDLLLWLRKRLQKVKFKWLPKCMRQSWLFQFLASKSRGQTVLWKKSAALYSRLQWQVDSRWARRIPGSELHQWWSLSGCWWNRKTWSVSRFWTCIPAACCCCSQTLSWTAGHFWIAQEGSSWMVWTLSADEWNPSNSTQPET